VSPAAQALSAEQVRWIARLARLELSDAELAPMAAQLSEVLGYVALLQQVNTEGVQPLAHALDLQNVFRADEPAPSLTLDAALANAPKRQQDFFAVPAVLD
jgi:aspartyl-tRNA(Asn)/glutamyl-tRNA(Gln) amidotransferase subunit C